MEIEQNNKNWFDIITETKKKIEKEKKLNPEFDEEKFAKDILLAMFFESQSEALCKDLSMSLKEEDKLKYVAKLEWLFERIGIYSYYFCKTPVDETYDAFDDFAFFLVRNGYASIDSRTFDTVYICANKYILKKVLEKYKDYEEFITIGKELILMDNVLVQEISDTHFLKEKRSRRRELL